MCIRDSCKCLVTGENLGQVASQTMEAMAVTGSVVTPVSYTHLDVYKRQMLLHRRIGRVGPVGRHVDLLECGGAGVNGLPVGLDHVHALLQVGLLRGVLHILNGVFLGQDLGQRKERGLQDGCLLYTSEKRRAWCS